MRKTLPEFTQKNLVTYSCRICLQISDMQFLLTPCLCKGSIQYVHNQCIVKWIKKIQEQSINLESKIPKVSKKVQCEICHSLIKYSVQSKYDFQWVPSNQFLQTDVKQKICIGLLLLTCMLCNIQALIILCVIDFKQNTTIYIIHCLIVFGCSIGMVTIFLFVLFEQYFVKLNENKKYIIQSRIKLSEKSIPSILIQPNLVFEQTISKLS